MDPDGDMLADHPAELEKTLVPLLLVPALSAIEFALRAQPHGLYQLEYASPGAWSKAALHSAEDLAHWRGKCDKSAKNENAAQGLASAVGEDSLTLVHHKKMRVLFRGGRLYF